MQHLMDSLQKCQWQGQPVRNTSVWWDNTLQLSTICTLSTRLIVVFGAPHRSYSNPFLHISLNLNTTMNLLLMRTMEPAITYSLWAQQAITNREYGVAVIITLGPPHIMMLFLSEITSQLMHSHLIVSTSWPERLQSPTHSICISPTTLQLHQFLIWSYNLISWIWTISGLFMVKKYPVTWMGCQHLRAVVKELSVLDIRLVPTTPRLWLLG